MTTVAAFLKRYAALTYFVLTFAISWTGVFLLIGGPGAIPASDAEVAGRALFVMLAWFAGPSVAGVVMTALVYGRAGLRDLLARMLHWRVGVRWYLAALLTAPMVFLTALLLLAQVNPAFLPGIFVTGDKVFLLIFGLVWGLIGGGLLEELGWTGFAVPELRKHFSAPQAAIIIGVLWGALHLPVIFWMSGGAIGAVPLALFFTLRGVDLLVGQLPAYRVLMVWVYDRTGSLLVAMLMHASLSASTFIFAPLALNGTTFLTYCLAITVTMWAVVGVTVIAHSALAPRQALRGRMT